MNPFATPHHSQWTHWTLFHGQSSVFCLSKKKIGHSRIDTSFWLEARSCQTKKRPWGQSRFALLPKFHGCRTRSWRIYLTKELREKSRDHGKWCAQLRNLFQLGPLEQCFTVYSWQHRWTSSNEQRCGFSMQFSFQYFFHFMDDLFPWNCTNDFKLILLDFAIDFAIFTM